MNVVPLHQVADEPPSNLEIEQALLGALLLANEAATNLPTFLEPRHFHESLHQQIYDVVLKLTASGKTANILTVRAFLPNDVAVGSLTLPQYLARLAAETTSLMMVKDYARIVFNHWRQRELLNAASAACQCGRDPEESLTGAFERIDELRAAGIEHDGTMRNAGAVVAARLGHGVAFFSLEMAARPIMARLQADELFDDHSARPITVNRILRADITPADFDRMTDAARAIEALPLAIDDAPQATIGSLYVKVRSVKKKLARAGKQLDLVIIDYLKFLRAGERYSGQRHYEVGEITAGLKGMAKELGVAVLLLAQLNRKVEERPDKRPQLADLRESGDIEADADVVMLLFREAYYLQNDPDIGVDLAKTSRLEEVANLLEIIIAKQRMGAVCTVQTYVNLECSAVRDLARRDRAIIRGGRP